MDHLNHMSEWKIRLCEVAWSKKSPCGPKHKCMIFKEVGSFLFFMFLLSKKIINHYWLVQIGQKLVMRQLDILGSLCKKKAWSSRHCNYFSWFLQNKLPNCPKIRQKILNKSKQVQNSRKLDITCINMAVTTYQKFGVIGTSFDFWWFL